MKTPKILPKKMKLFSSAGRVNSVRISKVESKKKKALINKSKLSEAISSEVNLLGKGRFNSEKSVQKFSLQLNNINSTTNNKNVKSPFSLENNTSPKKRNISLKKAKLPFHLESHLAGETPARTDETSKVELNKSKLNSPEVELGLQLEEALSPKSKRNKKRKSIMHRKLGLQGRLEVSMKSNKGKGSLLVKGKERQSRKNGSQGSNTQPDLKPSLIKRVNALNAVNTLLNTVEIKDSELLQSDNFIYLQFNVVKLSKEARGVYKILLPHCILPDPPEVCFIIPDLKGKRNDPEEAIDHFKEILKQKNVTVITEIIPVRKLKQEYSQYEELRKLANRIDLIINDGRITKVTNLGKRFAKYKKCICSVKFDSKNLKDNIEKALRRVPLFNSGDGTSFSVMCGRKGMSAAEVTDNIIAIGEFFSNDKSLIGEPTNISSVYVKMALSKAFPLYVSTVTPNEIHMPRGKVKNTKNLVEDEVTTVEDATVVVYSSGNVKVKKQKNEENDKRAEKILKPTIETKQIKYKKEETKKDLPSYDKLTLDGDASVGYSSSDSSFSSSSFSSQTPSDSEYENDYIMRGKGIEAAEKAYLEELQTMEMDVEKQKVLSERAATKRKEVNQTKKITQKNTKGIQNRFIKTKKSKSMQKSKGIQNSFLKKKESNTPQSLIKKNKKKLVKGN